MFQIEFQLMNYIDMNIFSVQKIFYKSFAKNQISLIDLKCFYKLFSLNKFFINKFIFKWMSTQKTFWNQKISRFLVDFQILCVFHLKCPHANNYITLIYSVNNFSGTNICNFPMAASDVYSKEAKCLLLIQ